MASDLAARLGTRFEARAVHVGDRIDIRGVEPRLSPQLPVIIEVAPSGYAILLRSGAVVLFGIDPIQQERFISDLGARVAGKFTKFETERATIRVGDIDGVDPDAMIVKDVTVGRLQVIAEILGKSVVLGHHELEIAEVFNAIEPMAEKMKTAVRRFPWKQRDLVRYIGEAMRVEQALVGRAEVLEKPDLLWDNPELDRFYTRLEDEYELRERHLALDTKLGVVTRSAQAMLELAQTKRSANLETYIVVLILLELLVAIIQLVR